MDYSIPRIPLLVGKLEAKCEEIGFTMPSDQHIGSLLRTLIRSKPGGHFLELGTGIGLSLAWMVDGLTANASILSIDNDPNLIAISSAFFNEISNLDLICQDGTEWIKNYKGERFDLIFADAWPGKYSELDEVLELLKPGGIYVIDDMNAQSNWPGGHAKKADFLVSNLEGRKDLTITKINWSSGVILAIKH